MPINPDAVGSKGEPGRHSWGSKDAILYALGVGAGAVDPLDELAFTTENTSDVTQQVLPTMAVVLGAGGASAFGTVGTFNPAMLVHGEEAITLHSPIPVEGEVETTGEITGIYDKGKGAVVEITSTSVDSSTDARSASLSLSALVILQPPASSCSGWRGATARSCRAASHPRSRAGTSRASAGSARPDPRNPRPTTA